MKYVASLLKVGPRAAAISIVLILSGSVALAAAEIGHGPYDTATLDARPSRVRAGAEVSVSGTGYGRKSLVTVTLSIGSDSTVVAQRKANRDGEIHFDVSIPRSADAGKATLVATALKSDGSRISASTNITILARPRPPHHPHHRGWFCFGWDD